MFKLEFVVTFVYCFKYILCYAICAFYVNYIHNNSTFASYYSIWADKWIMIFEP